MNNLAVAVMNFVDETDVEEISENSKCCCSKKGSSCWNEKLNKGAVTTATLLSVIKTLRLQNKNIFQGLQEILGSASGY